MQYHEKEEDLYCNKCQIKMAGVEYGDVCMRCALFVGFCEGCETHSTKLVYWFPCVDQNTQSLSIEIEINHQNRTTQSLDFIAI